MSYIEFPELVKAVFCERPNRFVVKCKIQNETIINKYNLDSNIVEAHLADPGRLSELLIEGRKLWLRYVDKKSRKTKWSTVLCKNPNSPSYVSLDSTLPNRLIAKALKSKEIDEFEDWDFVRSEYKKGGSRWDFLLKNRDEKMLLEVKSVTWAREGTGLFPDAVTARGKRHVEELTELNKEHGLKTGVLFVAQREDINSIRPAREIDVEFADALQMADKKGVKLTGRKCEISLEGIKLGRSIPIIL